MSVVKVDLSSSSKITSPVMDRIRESKPMELIPYSHESNSSIFSRWLAVTRSRVKLQLRHTNKKIDWVVNKTSEINAVASEGTYGLLASHNGNSLFWKCESETPEIVPPTEVPNLAPQNYLLWWLERKN